ncbi:MAG: MerR family transcriptional regulator [Polyangiales bacterium]
MTSTSSGSGGKIIQVHFGGARGKAGGRKRGRLGNGGDTRDPQAPAPIEPTRDVYTRAEVQKLLGTTETRLRTLEKSGVVVPSVSSGRRKAYTFGDLIALRAAIGLLTKGHRVRDVQRAIESLRRALPRVKRPLQESRSRATARR